MADVGDRIALVSKGEPRNGVVTAVSGTKITVRWDTGGETSLIPGPGVLSVVASRRQSRAAPTATTKSASASRSAVAKKAAPGKKSAVAKKAAPGKKSAVAKKAAAGKKAR